MTCRHCGRPNTDNEAWLDSLCFVCWRWFR